MHKNFMLEDIFLGVQGIAGANRENGRRSVRIWAEDSDREIDP